MLNDSKLNLRFWKEAITTTIYLKNRPSNKRVRERTTREGWSGKKVDLRHFVVFGCKPFVHLPKYKRGKFDPQGKECILIGYCPDLKGYRLVDIRNPT